MKGLVIVVLFAPILLADCPGGATRNATPAEIAFQKKVLDALVAAFPDAPEGFVKPDMAAAAASYGLPSLCAGSPPGSFRIALSGSYRRAGRIDPTKTPDWAAVAKLDEQIQSLKQMPPDLAAKYKALQDEMSAANSASRKAQRAQDAETAKAQRAISDAKYAEMTALETSHRQSVKTQLDGLNEQRSKLSAEINAKYTDEAIFTAEVNERAPDAAPDRAEVYFFGQPGRALKVNSVSAQLVAHPVTRNLFKIDKAKLSSLVGLQ